jgi:hypothetical protein
MKKPIMQDHVKREGGREGNREGREREREREVLSQAVLV